jgi:hypothetical protein
MLATCPVHPVILDFITLIIPGPITVPAHTDRQYARALWSAQVWLATQTLGSWIRIPVYTRMYIYVVFQFSYVSRGFAISRCPVQGHIRYLDSEVVLYGNRTEGLIRKMENIYYQLQNNKSVDYVTVVTLPLLSVSKGQPLRPVPCFKKSSIGVLHLGWDEVSHIGLLTATDLPLYLS